MSAQNSYLDADLGQYASGNCDIMALALHRLTGLPLGLWGAPFQDDLCEEGEYAYEYVHAVVVADADQRITIDAWGPFEGIPQNLYFSVAAPNDAALYLVSEDEVRSAFTAFDIDEEAIEAAMALVSQAPWIDPYLKNPSATETVRSRPSS